MRARQICWAFLNAVHPTEILIESVQSDNLHFAVPCQSADFLLASESSL